MTARKVMNAVDRALPVGWTCCMVDARQYADHISIGAESDGGIAFVVSGRNVQEALADLKAWIGHNVH